MRNPKFDAFLADLAAITKRHGVEIAGCGCCDSPYLTEAGPVGVGAHYKCSEYGGNVAFVNALPGKEHAP